MTLGLLERAQRQITLELFLGNSELKFTGEFSGGMNFRLLLTGDCLPGLVAFTSPFSWTRPLLTCEIGLRGFHPSAHARYAMEPGPVPG